MRFLNYDDNFIEDCLFIRLKELNLQNVLTIFQRKKSNKVKFKNYIIERLTKI